MQSHNNKAPVILFIAPTRIGDAVLATSLLEHIRTQHPNARVTIITSSLAAPLYEAYPNLVRLIVVDKLRHSMHWWKIWRATIGTRWHSVWDMRGSAIAYMVITRHRFVFNGCDLPMPKVQQYEQVLHLPALPFPRMYTRAEDEAFANALLGDAQNILAIAPCANWEPKEWPMAHFIEAAQDLCRTETMRPMIICAPHEQARAKPLLDALAAFTPINLTDGKCGLLGVQACLKRAALFIGNDSGLMHMAAAAGIPTIGLFGPTPHEIYQPYGVSARYLLAPEGKLSSLPITEVLHLAKIAQKSIN